MSLSVRGFVKHHLEGMAYMAQELDQGADTLLAQPGFQAALQRVEAALAEREEAQHRQGQQLSTDPAAVAEEIEHQRQRRQEAIAAFNAAADQLWAVLERSPGGALPPDLVPAATTLLRFCHADAPDAAPAAQLCPEVRALLDPSARSAAAAFFAGPLQRGGSTAGPTIAALPLEAYGEGVELGMLPGGRTCRLLADQRGELAVSGAAPWQEVAGLPGGPLNLQTLLFCLAAAERQVPDLHPLSLAMLDRDGGSFMVCSVCGMRPCLEAAHLRLVSRKLADSIEQRLAEL
ncbi:hypothetical protein ABPG75_013406 [Micractinium tetrahymenae]